MSNFINLRLLARPGNWVKVFLMLFIFAFAIHLFMNGKSPMGPSAGLSPQPN